MRDHKIPPSETSGARRATWIDALAAARRNRQPIAVDPNLSTCSLAEAYQIQAESTRRVLADIGGEVIGFKLGGTTEPTLARLNLGGPFHGPIFSSLMYESPAVLQRADFIACIIEAEIGVRIGRDIGDGPTTPTRDDLIAAIDGVFPAIEIADSRLLDWQQANAVAIISDNSYAGAWIRGEDAPNWQDFDLVDLPIVLRKDGEIIREGSGAMVLGDPLHALEMMISDLRQRGQTLRAGTLVSTGSCIAPFISPGAGRFVADFGPLGSVAMDLT